MLESEGHLYNRINNTELGFQYYLFNENNELKRNGWHVDREKDKINNGKW